MATKKRSTRRKATKRPARKQARRKPRKRAVAAKKRSKPRKRKAPGRKLVKQVERSSVERVMAGKRRRRKRSPRSAARSRRVAGPVRRRRAVSGFGGSGLLIGLGVGAVALYLLTRSSTPTTGTYQLPPIAQTSNINRNSQSSDIVNYAVAAGLAIDAITKLIDRLNSSSDQEVQNIYDKVATTGDFSNIA